MYKFPKTISFFFVTLSMLVLVITSYLNESIFMDRILLCCFILGVVVLARLRSGVHRADHKQENG